MTDEVKNSVSILLEKFKEDKITHEEFMTMLEALFPNNTIPTYYPVTIPWSPFNDNPFDDRIRYNFFRPYCGDGDYNYTTTTDSFSGIKENKNL